MSGSDRQYKNEKKLLSMKKTITLCLLVVLSGYVSAQSVFTLDSCRNMAIRNNKQLQMAKERVTAAEYNKKAAVTNYLPSIDFTGAYLYNQKNVSLLSEGQFLPVGTKDANGGFTLRPDQLLIGEDGRPVMVNGQYVPKDWAYIPKEAFEFDIRNTFVGAVSVTQPIFMGGKIRAYNQITKFAEQLAESQQNTAIKDLIFQLDETYWQVVSLVSKKKLAEKYVELLRNLNQNVQSMIQEGVATQSDGLSVAVKLNEAEVMLVKVDNGLALSKMLLAQMCGLPIDLSYVLADENSGPQTIPTTVMVDMDQVYANRSELHSLQFATKIYEKKQQVVASGMLPQVALTGSYLFSNPSSFNGFQNRFDGMFNVGVMVKIPLLHWGENIYKLKSSKAETRIARLELAEAKEKIELQVNQAAFKVKEAARKMEMTEKNMAKAEENLRSAQLGFEEGVLTTTNVLEAQTAWVEAESEKIDARIDMRLCEVYLSKALGTFEK